MVRHVGTMNFPSFTIVMGNIVRYLLDMRHRNREPLTQREPRNSKSAEFEKNEFEKNENKERKSAAIVDQRFRSISHMKRERTF